jgi:hypothetical protein
VDPAANVTVGREYDVAKLARLPLSGDARRCTSLDLL